MKKYIFISLLITTITFTLIMYTGCFFQEKNLPPEKPSPPTGRVKINIREKADYRSMSQDPNKDDIRYGWDWNGDNIVDEWTELFSFNKTLVNTNHEWTINGTFYLKVKAQDIHGAESEWSNSLKVIVNFVSANPNRPNLTGPTSIVVGEVGVYYAVTTTSDNFPIRFYFMWGDMAYNMTDLVEPGEMVNVSHAWNTPGNYTIVCEAENQYFIRSHEAILNVVVIEK